MTEFSTTEADVADQAVINAGVALGNATRLVMELEDERPLIKTAAQRRLMELHSIAATVAEKRVEEDGEFMAHRRKQYDAVVGEARAKGTYQAACNRARRVTALVVALAGVAA